MDCHRPKLSTTFKHRKLIRLRVLKPADTVHIELINNDTVGLPNGLKNWRCAGCSGRNRPVIAEGRIIAKPTAGPARLSNYQPSCSILSQPRDSMDVDVRSTSSPVKPAWAQTSYSASPSTSAHRQPGSLTTGVTAYSPALIKSQPASSPLPKQTAPIEIDSSPEPSSPSAQDKGKGRAVEVMDVDEVVIPSGWSAL